MTLDRVETADNDERNFIICWVCGLEVLELLGIKECFSENKNWPYLFDSLLPFEKGRSPQYVACDCRLTVIHILFDCVDFIESRNRHCTKCKIALRNSFKR